MGIGPCPRSAIFPDEKCMGISFLQIMMFLAVVLLLFGATRLPALARSLGQSITEFKKGMKELEDHSSDKPEH